MEIKWFGHACFQIRGKEGTLLIDPYSEKVGLQLPKLKPNIVLISHHHFDHDDLSRIEGEPLIFDTPGEFEAKGFFIKGIGTFHDKERGSSRGGNTIFLIKSEGISVLHSGDLGHPLASETLEALGSVDILLIPVGGTYTIDGREAAVITKEIEPRIVIPMHYKIPGLALEISGAESFIKAIGLTAEKADKLTISHRSQLPEEETRLILLAPAV